MGGRTVIIDPSCSAAHGHHLTSLLDLIAAVAPRTVEVMVNSAMPDGAFPAGVTVHRVFQSTVYDEPGLGSRPNGRLARRAWKLRRSAARLQADLTRKALALAGSVSPEAALRSQDWAWSRWRIKWPTLEAILRAHARDPIAHIVVPSSDVELICGLAELRSAIPGLRDTAIHARLISLAPELAVLAPRDAQPSYQALVAQRLQGVHLYVETPAMQRQVQAVTGLASAVYPYLVSPPPFTPVVHHAGSGFVFGYFGAMRNEKGFSRLLPILRTVAERRSAADPHMTFLIHASDATADEAVTLRSAFGALTGAGLACELLTGSLDTATYARLFNRIDATLLPYTGERYKVSGSGILCEALAAGKAAILTRGMAASAFCTPDMAIEATTDDEFTDAILAMARSADHYRAGALARAASYATEVKACPLLVRLAG